MKGRQISLNRFDIILWSTFLWILSSGSSIAATCTVDATQTNQFIHCIGASSAWSAIGSQGQALFADDNVNGHIGISSLRARIDPNNSFSSEVSQLATAHSVNPNVLLWATEWSPPAQYKANNNVDGGASNDTFLGASSGSPNSADTGLASYQVSFIQYAQSHGAPLYALSIQNEPNFNPTYEACLWTAGQFDVYAQAFHTALQNAGLTTKIMLPEPDNTFGMNLASTAMDDSTVAPFIGIIGTHLYGTPNAGLLSSFGYTHVTNQEWWETEISGNTTDIPGALQEAGWIQNSLVNSNMNAFHYWWLTDLISNNTLTIKAYVLGNYSKFIRPGYYRMGATAVPSSGVSVSAFKNTNTSSPQTIVFVAINGNGSSVNQTFSINGVNVTSVTPWVTDGSNNLVAKSPVAVSGNSFTYSLTASSVTSFVGVVSGTSAPTATKTNTPVPPTPTKTNTPVPPTATLTATHTSTPTSTVTSTATRTNTPVPPTNTPTKTATVTSTVTSTPTKTFTSVPPTATYTFTSVPPTATSTLVPPTGTTTPLPATPTLTLAPPTSTNTPVPPTATFTFTLTPVPPTATLTKTATAVPPTLTNTPVPPTATFTHTPMPPTFTFTPSPVPPTATFTPVSTGTGSFTVYLLSGVTSNTTNSPHPFIEVVNTGTGPLNLNNVEVRYWFNCDCTGQTIQSWVDWAGLLPAGTSVTGDVLNTVQTTNLGGQTDYVSYKFTGNLVLQPGQMIQIQSRFNKNDWSNMLQNTDWSYMASTSYVQAPNITGYVNGTLVWGHAPTTTAPATQKANLLAFPNPSTGTGVNLSLNLPGNASGIGAKAVSASVGIDPNAVISFRAFTVDGQLVWVDQVTGASFASAGNHSLYWNERNLENKSLASGLYIVTVTIKSNEGTSTASDKVFIVK
jgi:glucuronoarabinoxylan endo-1,4-beta-xylanase